MTLQQLKYVIEVADRGSITEAAKSLFIAQPSLSAAIHELEAETDTKIFQRSSRGVLITPEGAEFLGYARQVVQQAALIEDKYIARSSVRQRFSVSTQHYSFTSSAFVELVRAQGGEAYEFTLREGKTYDTINDVRTLRSEMGVIYLSSFNEAVIRKMLREANLVFSELFSARPHIFVGRNNPLAGRESVTLVDLEPLPCLTYEQGDQNAFYFSEEILSTLNHEKSIKVTDKGTIIDLMVGTDGYTISSGICPSYLRGDDIISIPLTVDEVIRIGVITHRDYRPTVLGETYLRILHRVVGDMQEMGEEKGCGSTLRAALGRASFEFLSVALDGLKRLLTQVVLDLAGVAHGRLPAHAQRNQHLADERVPLVELLRNPLALRGEMDVVHVIHRDQPALAHLAQHNGNRRSGIGEIRAHVHRVHLVLTQGEDVDRLQIVLCRFGYGHGAASCLTLRSDIESIIPCPKRTRNPERAPGPRHTMNPR